MKFLNLRKTVREGMEYAMRHGEFNMSLVFAPNARHVQNMRCYLNQMRREYPTHVFSIRNFCGTVKIFATKVGEKNEDLI